MKISKQSVFINEGKGIIRCLNHLKWPLSMWRNSGFTLSSCQMAQLLSLSPKGSACFKQTRSCNMSENHSISACSEWPHSKMGPKACYHSLLLTASCSFPNLSTRSLLHVFVVSMWGIVQTGISVHTFGQSFLEGGCRQTKRDGNSYDCPVVCFIKLQKMLDTTSWP